MGLRPRLVRCKSNSESKMNVEENIFQKWKHFQVFGCVFENALESPFYHVSHIFLGFKQILLQRIKIYKQSKKQKSKQKNQNHKTNHERGIEREKEIKWWVGEDEGWVGGVPSPCSAWGMDLLSLGVSPARMCFGGVCLFVFLDHSLYSLFLLFLTLSLFGCLESGNHLKVKEKRKWFSGSKGLFYSQSLRFSGKLYFTCAPKHAAEWKIFSRNHLHPKQTQPKIIL